MRYRPSDLDRLGDGARRQIAAAKYAFEARDTLAAAKKSKFHNVRTETDGILFDSKAEADRYWQLKILHRVGRITELVLQPEFPITVNGITVAKYIADFEYTDDQGRRVIEDVKSPATSRHPLFRLKKKLVEALHGITITEVP
jgi:hypothetical protein